MNRSWMLLCVGVVLLVAACQSSSDGASIDPAEPNTDLNENALEQVVEPTQPEEADPTGNTSLFSRATPTVADEQYVPDGDLRHRLDVYLPAEGEDPFPTILAFHGGGFRARSKQLYQPLANHFTDQGYALVAANYRFTAGGVHYPAQVEDAFCALGWIHANSAKYGFDPERVFLMGDSAGGYLAAMVGTAESAENYRGACPHEIPQSDWIRGTIIWYGIYDLVSMEGLSSQDQSLLEALMGSPHSEMPQGLLAEMSPKSWIDGSEAPFLVIHGTLDPSIASWLAEEFAEVLEAAGVEATLLLVEDRHGFILQPVTSPTMTEAMEAIDRFLEESN